MYKRQVIGIITTTGEVLSELSYESHSFWGYHYGSKWRYNPQTKIVYWSCQNWSDQTNDNKIDVENHLHKKYGYEVKDHIDMNCKGGYKYVGVSHGDVINETHSNNARFGLGVVDSSGHVNFKEHNRDTFSSQTHGDLNPYGRWRFRYVGGEIDWTDAPEKEQEHIVLNYFTKKGWPVTDQYYVYDDDYEVDEDYSSDEKDTNAEEYFKIGQEDPETTAKSFCWIWSRADQGLRVKQGKTHGANFGHEIAGNTFKGWYDPEKKAISFVFPEQALRKIGDRKPTEDDIPTIVHRKLESQFGKDNKFFVFESIKHYQLKRLIKEIVLMAKGKK